MATVAHLAAGALCGAVYARKTSASPAVAVPLFAALAAAPDLDFIAVYQFGAEGTPLDHRAATHAIPVAAVVGAACGAAFGRRPHRALAALIAFIAIASHGIMDAMTASASGPRLWWPFTAAQIALAWQPIPGTRTWQEYFTAAGLQVLTVETLLSLPLVALTAWMLLRTRPAEAERRRERPAIVDGPLPSSD